MRNISVYRFDRRLEAKVGEIVEDNSGRKYECVAVEKGCYRCAFDKAFPDLCTKVACSKKARSDNQAVRFDKRKDL